MFTDKDRTLFIPDEHIVPTEPFWKSLMALGLKASQTGDFGAGVVAIIDEDDMLLAVELPAPSVRGVPSEAVINALRQFLNEEDITEVIDVYTKVEEAQQEIEVK